MKITGIDELEQVKLSLSIDSGSIPMLEYEDEASEATLDLRTTSSHSGS